MTLPLRHPSPTASPTSRPGTDRAQKDPAQVVWLTSQDRDRAISIWREIEATIPSPPLMATSVWTETWLKHYGDLIEHQFALLKSDSRYLGIVLLTRGVAARVGIWQERCWHLGTAGEPDGDSVCVEYNAILCQPLHKDQFFQAIFAHLETQNDWDSGRLDGLAISELPNGLFDDPRWQVTTKLARWFDLDAPREGNKAPIQYLGDSTRKNIRQSLKKLDTPRFEAANTVEHAQDIFSDLITLHQKRWNAVGSPGCYASERFTNFHRELIDKLVPDRMLLTRISISAGPIGCSQILIDGPRALVYQGGRLEVQEFSPGLVTDYLTLQECYDRGLSAYDFMAGDSLHKQRLTTCTTPLCWAVYRRPRWKYRLTDALKAGRAKYRAWRTNTSRRLTAGATSTTQPEGI